MTSPRTRLVFRMLLAITFVGAGMNHFINPDFYVSFMPPYLPWPLELVWISGVCEILGGIGVLIRPLRRIACWGLIALLIAVFPANVQLTINWYEEYGWSIRTILSLV